MFLQERALWKSTIETIENKETKSTIETKSTNKETKSTIETLKKSKNNVQSQL